MSGGMCGVDFWHLASKLVTHCKQTSWITAQWMYKSHDRPPPRKKKTVVRGSRWLLEEVWWNAATMLLQLWVQCNLSWGDWEWKTAKTKSVDNICGDLCWTQAVVHNAFITMLPGDSKYLVLILKTSLCCFVLNCILIEFSSGRGTLWSFLIFLPYVLNFYKFLKFAHLNKQLISSTKLSTHKYKQ